MDIVKILLKLFGLAKDHIDNDLENARPLRPERPVQRPVRQAEVTEKSPSEWKTYFKSILQSEFPSYSIRENVPVTDLAGFVSDKAQLYTTRPTQVYKAEWGQPYTFVLECDGKAKAVVMLGNGHSHDSNVKYLIARMYAEKLELPYINFYTQMPNERNYVIGRIRKFLN